MEFNIMNISKMRPAGQCVVDRMIEHHDDVPHLAGGLSQHGSCLSKQIYNGIYHPAFDGHGNVTPGTALHKYIQEDLCPSGLVMPDEMNEPLYLIIGHEQYVFHIADGKPHRRSPIDTLVWNLQTHQYEIWDWKSTAVGGTRDEPMKYLRKLDSTYKSQCNFYGVLFKKALRLDYNPVCRVIFFNKNNWSYTKEFVWETDELMGEQSESDIYTVDMVKDSYEMPRTKKEWQAYSKRGRNYWSSTATPYLKMCQFCDHRDRCVADTGIDFPARAFKY